MAPTTFLGKLEAAARANHSWLCVGLDPDPALVPIALRTFATEEWVVRFNQGIIESTSDLVCCYKPNLAFYEALGDSGWRALRATLRAIPPHIPTLADAKRGDISNSSRGYAKALFETLGFDAATVNPYLGGDALQPFFDYPDKGVFVLCKTSNPGAGELQDLRVCAANDAEEPLYRVIARRALEWDRHGTVGLVVGATYPEDLASVRQLAPRVPILIPGVGTQAGDLEASVRAGADTAGERAIVNVSRAVLYASASIDGEAGAERSTQSDWQEAARKAALALRDSINAARLALAGPP
jgi:orotidine-5'-phosphate decarboxylase